jgi:hypothetical protein
MSETPDSEANDSRIPDLIAPDLDASSRIFRYFGEVETPRLNSNVYTAFSLGVAEDRELLELAAHALPGQPQPNVLYAAVHDMLLQDAEAGVAPDPLASWYPSVSGQEIPEASPWEAFRNFCLERRERLQPVIANGRTQTCVVHRSAVILPALACLPALDAASGRVGLLEVGPSAGLNLRLDQYRYEYCDARGGRVEWGDAEARPRIVVKDLGTSPPPLPKRLDVVARRGLELNPLDLSDADAVRWLRALIWPEHVARAQAMDAALEHVARVPAEIHAGDATRDIEAHVGALPEDAARVVFATHVFYQISGEGREAIHEGLARESSSKRVDLILMESNGQGDSFVTHHSFENGAPGPMRRLARADSHGRSLTWLAR